MSRTLKDLDLYKAEDREEISPYVLKECTQTLDTTLELFKKTMEEGLLPGSGREQPSCLFLRKEVEK